jgi:hypothetical protein
MAAGGGADVPAMIYYRRPLHRQAPYERFPITGDCLAATDRLAESVLSLPMHPSSQPKSNPESPPPLTPPAEPEPLALPVWSGGHLVRRMARLPIGEARLGTRGRSAAAPDRPSPAGGQITERVAGRKSHNRATGNADANHQP